MGAAALVHLRPGGPGLPNRVNRLILCQFCYSFPQGDLCPSKVSSVTPLSSLHKYMPHVYERYKKMTCASQPVCHCVLPLAIVLNHLSLISRIFFSSPGRWRRLSHRRKCPGYVRAYFWAISPENPGGHMCYLHSLEYVRAYFLTIFPGSVWLINT